jgi:hypothetical protein
MDNASVHKAKSISKLLSCLCIHYNSAYSPQLNPVEETFSIWKRRFRDINTKGSHSILINIIEASLGIGKRLLNALYKHALVYHLKCYLNKTND